MTNLSFPNKLYKVKYSCINSQAEFIPCFLERKPSQKIQFTNVSCPQGNYETFARIKETCKPMLISILTQTEYCEPGTPVSYN